jgi:hypothetical protein
MLAEAVHSREVTGDDSERAQRLSDRFADRNEAWDLLWISVCFSDHVLHFLGAFCENI